MYGTNHKIDWNQYDHMLGQSPDQHLALQIKCSPKTVRTRRISRNIPSYHSQIWLDGGFWSQHRHLLGTMSDENVGLLVSRKRSAVQQARLHYNVPAYGCPEWSTNDKKLLNEGKRCCVKCLKEKSNHSFRITKGSVNRTCYQCSLKKQKNTKAEKKNKLVLLFGGSCTSCGFKEHISALQFHHVNQNEKDVNISYLLQLRENPDLIQNEINKCCLLCSNCHDAYHSGELEITFIKSTIGFSVEK